jgi:Cu/Ag efflux pump CusA
LRDRGYDALAAMREAGRIRLRPILMTSVASIFGALPIALGLGAGAGSRRPLGYSIIGGLIVSTLLTLFLVPAVYVVFERLRARRVRVAATNGSGGGVIPGEYSPVSASAAASMEVR